MTYVPDGLTISEIAEATCISAKRIEKWDLTDEEEVRVVEFCELFEQ